MRNELEYWLLLNAVEGLSIHKKVEIVSILGGVKNVFEADKETLIKLGFTIEQYRIYHSPDKERDILCIIDICQKKRIRILSLSHDEYPEMLKYIQDPPLLLYARGNIPFCNFLAVVGSRKASGYGIETAVKISSEISLSGLTVVSGMARGIDTAAHCGALNTENKTVAVLGCGVDTPYPPENRALMERIVSSGAVISEYPPGTPPAAFHFPSRNRIISGMALGTLVVEAGLKSGSLITANCSLEQGREVFAIPGNISNYNSMGTNKLIKDGAKIVMSIDDILDELSFGYSPITKKKKKSSYQSIEGLEIKDNIIIDMLKIEDLFEDELSCKTEIPLAQLYELLLNLELKGIIKKSITGKYMLLA